MLLNVHIKNIALIDDANVNFTDNLNILTGETGAGKSIIMGALKIGMGDKLPKDIVREPDKEGFCQLLFLVDDPQVIEQIRDLGVEPSEDGEILITRRINNSRTINTINDMAVTAAKLREVSALLIDMHTQHQQQTLLKKAEHMKLLDKYGRASIDPLKQKVAECHREYVTFRREMDELSMDEAERSRKVEFLKYQIAEIESATVLSFCTFASSKCAFSSCTLAFSVCCALPISVSSSPTRVSSVPICFSYESVLAFSVTISFLMSVITSSIGIWPSFAFWTLSPRGSSSPQTIPDIYCSILFFISSRSL